MGLVVQLQSIRYVMTKQVDFCLNVHHQLGKVI